MPAPGLGVTAGSGERQFQWLKSITFLGRRPPAWHRPAFVAAGTGPFSYRGSVCSTRTGWTRWRILSGSVYDPDAILALIYTSGTTGLPRALW